MNAIIFQVLTVLVSAGGGAVAVENPLLTDLLSKGVEMPDGQVFTLPVPFMAEGLSEEKQTAVLAKQAPGGKLELFLDKSSGAPVYLKLGKRPAKQGDDVIRSVDLCFVVYGDWNVLIGDKFSNSILKKDQSKANNQASTVSKAGNLKTPEMAVRRLSTRSTPDLKEYFLYTTFKLFDRVELSATRFGVATKTPTGVVVATSIDSRFAKDKEYPNQWQEIVKDAAGNPVLGPIQPYSGAGFYAKVTRLNKPQDSIFVEFHSVFYEPRGWFGEDEKLLPTELRKIIPYQVKQFRIKLMKASMEAAEKGPATEDAKKDSTEK
jgi:hypothetical protein